MEGRAGANILFVLMIASGALLSCAERIATQEERAIAIAEDFIGEKMPGFNVKADPPIVLDRGDSWIVTYNITRKIDSRTIRFGAAPAVKIDKQSLSVTDFEISQ